MEKIVVTGSTGFIGKKLTEKLIQNGYDVIQFSRDFKKVSCDRIYHLACPSSTSSLNENPTEIMDVIFDKTREAISICPKALFVNASSFGASDINDTKQGAYNIAKRSMEVYLKYSGIKYINYRIPSVYGEDASSDSFIKRCVLGTAYEPENPSKMWFISHVDDVTDALINLSEIKVENITLGEIYKQFTSGKRRLEKYG